jgi:hypothetical protein
MSRFDDCLKRHKLSVKEERAIRARAGENATTEDYARVVSQLIGEIDADLRSILSQVNLPEPAAKPAPTALPYGAIVGEGEATFDFGMFRTVRTPIRHGSESSTGFCVNRRW